MKYSIAFTSGSLFFKEAEALIASIRNPAAFLAGDEEVDKSVLPVNSEASQKRIKRELERRLRALPDEDLLICYRSLSENGKKLVLLYATCRYYPIIADFMLETVLNKYRNMDFDLSAEDFQNFLYRKMDEAPDLMGTTEKSRIRAGQVVIRMLREVGTLQKSRLQKKEFDPTVLQIIAANGDQWFLEAVFLSAEERSQITAR